MSSTSIDTHAFFALSLENELQYHCVRINSGNDVATSCKNWVNFFLVTPEITELICIPRYLSLAKIDLQGAHIKNNPLEKILHFSHGSTDLSQTFRLCTPIFTQHIPQILLK